MNKILSAIAIATLAISAQAATIGASYETEGARHSELRASELRVTLAQKTTIGTFDAALTGARFKGNTNHDDANGFEVGYSNSLAYKSVTFTGRLGYGRLNQIDPNGGAYTGNTSYSVIQAEAATPLAANVTGFVGYRHRTGLNSDTTTQNRYSIGADFAVAKNLTVRGSAFHTLQDGMALNGLAAALTYGF